MATSQIRYTETFPDTISLTFATNEEYNIFQQKRFDEVCKKLSLFAADSKYNKAIKLLLVNHIDLNRLDIRIKRR